MARPPKPALPLREGVAASAVHCPPGAWPSLTAFLNERLPRVDDWAERLARGDVVGDDGAPLQDRPYVGNRRVYYWRQLPQEPAVPGGERILFQDEHLLVADKPHFLPVTPSGLYARETLMARLRHATGLVDLNPVHRLDRETAGLVVFNLRRQDRDAYHRLFRERSVSKVYEAVAPWSDGPWPRVLRHRLQEPPGDDFMQMQVVPGEPNAETWVNLIEPLQGAWQGWARYELRPVTGQRHQLRAQMNAIGLPLWGDRIYPVLQPHENPPSFDRPLQLVARAIAFTDPVTGESRSFTRGALTMAP
ncbi:pseudouridine synthase [Roseateles sp. BYS87W]|uniref:Pseudouridine synthase n=1 Tax=Pelomonas baiyunensis TaxID=3299026 RepID=A0ABW7H265_9BURK